MRLADCVMRFVAQQGMKPRAMHLNDAPARCSDLALVCNHHDTLNSGVGRG
jgi:hypothetical protein